MTTTKTLTALETIELLGIISSLSWQDADRDCGFDGADLLADVPNEAAGRLSEMTGVSEDYGMLAVIGNGGIAGDPQQIEIHGTDATTQEASCFSFTLNSQNITY